MGTAIFVLAGQSNARALREDVLAALEATYGAGGFALVEVDASGAPLTYKRSLEDWYAAGELRADLVDQTRTALAADAEARLEGIIWVQGEGDTHAIARAGEYTARLESLMESFRAAIALDFAGRDTGAETARLAISALSDVAPDAAGRDNWQVVADAQAEVAAGDPRAILVDPDLIAAANGIAAAQMFTDALHYATGFRPLLAQALVAAAGEAAQGAGPPPLLGTERADRINGTKGADLMIGGLGDDTYVVNHAGDEIIELDGGGHDLVIADRSFSLRYHGQTLEDLKLTGRADLEGTGNGLDNVIRGNRGDNRLDGAWGDDVLIGGAGDDWLRDAQGYNRLKGGAGNDTYEIVHKGNRIVEGKHMGDDLVLSAITFSLRADGKNIERLTLTGTGLVDGTGNGLDNVLTGNGAANTLNGAWGNDVIDGGAGDDTLIGHRGDDVLTGGAGADIFVFRPGDGDDRVTDFDPAEDRIALDAAIARGHVELVEQGGDLLVRLGTEGSVLLEGLVADDLHSWSIVTL